MLPELCIVLRDGVSHEIRASQLAVGDVCMLRSGSRVPSDLRIIHQAGLKLDTSMLTGENMPVKLTEVVMAESVSLAQAKNMAFMGSNVVEGEGVGLVSFSPFLCVAFCV